MQFDRVGAFEYSHEEDTSAFELEDDISSEEKNHRMSLLMEVQREISYNKNIEKVGKELKVLLDRKEGDFYIGRTQYDSPEVDNEVLIETSDNLTIGDFVQVKITDAEDFDLYGEIIEKK